MTSPGPTSKRVRLQAAGMLALALLAGFVGGVVVERLRATAGPEYARDGSHRYRRDRSLGPYGRLDLDSVQRDRIAAIFETHRGRTDSLMESVLPALRGEYRAAWQEIATILTPDQRAEMERVFERRGWRSHRSSGPAIDSGTAGR